MPQFPPAVSDFKSFFDRDFRYGTGFDTVRDIDIQRAINATLIVYNRSLLPDDTSNIAFLNASAHFVVLSVQAAGGLTMGPNSAGVGTENRGEGAIISRTAASVSVTYQLPESMVNNPVLAQFLETGYGKKYLQMVVPRMIGNVQVVAGEFPIVTGLAGKPLPLSITTLSLPGATNGTPYSAPLSAVGGVSPLTWSVSSGTLPTGLTLNANTGLISGTPTVSGSSYFAITVTDGLSVTATMNYQIVVT